MTELLGNEALIDSLRNDVQDLHWAITDMISRIGPVQQSSWKFPDKMSSELDIEDLLDLYSVSDDLEENQVAHIALYELVIDRFLYLVQILSTFTKQMIAKAGNEIQDTNYTSIGLTVKQCCSRQVQLQTIVQQTMSDIKTKSRKVSDLENNMKKMSEDIEQMTNGTGSQISLCSHGSHVNQSKPFTGWLSPSKMEEISRDACSKNTQTIETAFVPCEACGMVQRNLRQIGDTIINMCQSQKLPSSLQKFRPLVAEMEWLSSIDVARWVSEQSKDISRMNKHLDYLMSTINPLKQEVENSEKKCRKLEIRVANFDKDMAREREVQEALQKQFEVKIKNLEDSHRETVCLINKQKDEIFSNKLALEDQLEQHKNDLQRQKKLLEELEKTRSQLERDLKENKTNSTEIQSLQSDLSSLQGQLKDVSSKLEKANKGLSREQAKNKSSSKHSQSLQTKQGSLMHRIDDLDQENQDLRDQVATLEDEKDVIEESLQKAAEKTKQLTKKLKQSEDLIEQISTEKVELEKSICSLQDNIKIIEGKLEEATERERLLIEYPDLNGPVNPDLTGTGDIVRDMENQVHANSIRIQVLEEQNEGLRHSVSKIMAAQGHKPKDAWKQKDPMQLWSKENLETLKDHGHNTHQTVWNQEKSVASDNYNNSATDQYYQKDSQHGINIQMPSANATSPDKSPTDASFLINGNEFLVGKGSRPPSAVKRKNTPGSRPSSGKMVMAPVNSSSISAYIQLKRAGKLGLNETSPPSLKKKGGNSSNPVDGDYKKKEMYSCNNCDKMYSKLRDLEIHKSYCTA